VTTLTLFLLLTIRVESGQVEAAEPVGIIHAWTSRTAIPAGKSSGPHHAESDRAGRRRPAKLWQTLARRTPRDDLVGVARIARLSGVISPRRTAGPAQKRCWR
jgi:hypothetical protein